MPRRRDLEDPPLRKEDIESGFILWLPNCIEASERGDVSYKRSGLYPGACEHPVLIIKKLGDHVWVVIMSSSGNLRHKTVPVLYGETVDCELAYAECRVCRAMQTSGKKDGITIYNSLRSRPHSHVGVERVFEVSLAMLRRERTEPKLGDYRVDDASLERVIKATEAARKTLEHNSFAFKNLLRCPPVKPDDLPDPTPIPERIDGHTTRPTLSTSSSDASTLTPPSTPESSPSLPSTDLSTSTATSPTQSSQSSSKLRGVADSQEVDRPTRPRTDTHISRKIEELQVFDAAKARGNAVLVGPLQSEASSTATVQKSSDEMITAVTAASVVRLTTMVGSSLTTQNPPAGHPQYLNPGTILWYTRGEYRANTDPLAHISKKNNRPCVFLCYGAQNSLPRVVFVTTLAGESLREISLIPAFEKDYYLPIVKKGCNESITPRSLHIADGKSPSGSRISYIDVNRVSDAKVADLQIPREGQLHLTDDSLRILFSMIRERRVDPRCANEVDGSPIQADMASRPEQTTVLPALSDSVTSKSAAPAQSVVSSKDAPQHVVDA